MKDFLVGTEVEGQDRFRGVLQGVGTGRIASRVRHQCHGVAERAACSLPRWPTPRVRGVERPLASVERPVPTCPRSPDVVVVSCERAAPKLRARRPPGRVWALGNAIGARRSSTPSQRRSPPCRHRTEASRVPGRAAQATPTTGGQAVPGGLGGASLPTPSAAGAWGRCAGVHATERLPPTCGLGTGRGARPSASAWAGRAWT